MGMHSLMCLGWHGHGLDCNPTFLHHFFGFVRLLLDDIDSLHSEILLSEALVAPSLLQAFGLSAQEAAMVDPQHRLLLEMAAEVGCACHRD